MVRTRLRALERKLVLERAEVRLERMVSNLVLEWGVAKHFGRQIPEPMDFIPNIIREGFFPRSSIKALYYLEECKREDQLPEQRRLLQILLPGRAQTRPGVPFYGLGALRSGMAGFLGIDFGSVIVPSSISGQVFDDQYADGVNDAIDSGLQNWEVSLYSDQDIVESHLNLHRQMLAQ